MNRLGLVAVAFAASLVAQDAPADVTYSKQISRIFREKCETCHRENDIAPFALNDYQAAFTWRRDIRRVVSEGIMPPWKPKKGVNSFRGNYGLTDEEKTQILTWLENGAPEGDPADMPDPLAEKSEWPLGTPDLELKMTQSYTPAIGKDVYRCFVIPTGLVDTKYLTAVDVIPGNRKIVHHVILYTDTTGTAEKLDGADGQPGYDCFGGPGVPQNLSNSLGIGLAGWAPGQRTSFLPDNIGIELAKDAKIVMQVHYSPLGLTGEDQTRIGLYYMTTDLKQRLFQIPVVNTRFKIPAGEEKYPVTASLSVLPFMDGDVIWVYPHMHLLGNSIKVEVVDAQRKTTPMIEIEKWDFNWQGSYTFTEKMRITSGSRINLTCTFNNSESNARNPNNPLIPVGWGENTSDEMCLAFLGVTLDYEKYLTGNR
jgi:hypothetical protein